MITIEQNYFSSNFNYFEPTNTEKYSLVKSISTYIELLRGLHTLKKVLKSNFNNFDTYLLVNKLNTIETIDNVLINLEDLSEFTNEVLNKQELQTWSSFPIRYMTDKVEDWNMALQGLLLSKQAHL
ncbi:MAG: Unknown protein [uncultured Sulfurovum sp.]|uniref:Uncharacterized protein n=1 Tax=uncultured Sulfurovum sp. TaxID=269237 RepID=A0A6S6SD17_9BACT|nr:MAG: Unknown protein [uncultured Sulfurovum sp.]